MSASDTTVKTANPVLKNISFQALPGQMVAILGATGSGKSTLINLIPRFYDVTSGSVTIDGVDVRDISKKALRGNIGIAMQDVMLFSGSIKENIAFGKPDARFEEIVQAAKSAQAHDFITGLPGGYETIPGAAGGEPFRGTETTPVHCKGHF